MSFLELQTPCECSRRISLEVQFRVGIGHVETIGALVCLASDVCLITALERSNRTAEGERVQAGG